MGKVTWCIFLSDWDQEREIQICLREIDKFLFTNKTHSGPNWLGLQQRLK